MAYNLKRAANTMAIAEQEYACVKEAQFTSIDSCIGILAKKKGEDKVIGMHLVLIGQEKSILFDVKTAMEVVEIFKTEEFDAATVVLVGDLESWKQNVRDAYNYLCDQMKPTQINLLGVFNGKIGDGNVILKQIPKD